jgi:hypothetical protein
MAQRKTQLTGSQKDNLLAICELGAAPLRRIVDALATTKLLIRLEDIRALIVAEAGEQHGEHLATFLFGVAVAHRRDASSPDATLENVSDLVSQLTVSDPSLARWPECRPILTELLHSKSIRAATKALDVSYDFERLYLDGRFLTSIRPIFNAERDDIVGAAVVQTLRLEYMSAEGDRSTLSIAVDKADIQQLLDSCTRAIKKADLTVGKASEVWNLPTLLPGERS